MLRPELMQQLEEQCALWGIRGYASIVAPYVPPESLQVGIVVADTLIALRGNVHARQIIYQLPDGVWHKGAYIDP